MSERLEERLRRAARTYRRLGNHTAEGMFIEAADTICELKDENAGLRELVKLLFACVQQGEDEYGTDWSCAGCEFCDSCDGLIHARETACKLGVELNMSDNEKVLTYEDAMAEHGWVRLPVDEDGVPIHIGDVMEWVDIDGEVEVVCTVDAVGVDCFFAWDAANCRYSQKHASAYRHHRAPTVENDQLKSENAKLRELVRDMWPHVRHRSRMCRECELPCRERGECLLYEPIRDRMRELGVEI